jgi:hypothetical protein
MKGSTAMTADKPDVDRDEIALFVAHLRSCIDGINERLRISLHEIDAARRKIRARTASKPRPRKNGGRR